MPDIMHRLTVHRPLEKVFAAITTAEGVRCWWVRDADLQSGVGGAGEFRFLHYGPDHIHQVKVESLEAPYETTWHVFGSFLPDWINTKIVFHLTATSMGTDVRFTHRGFPQADDVYAMCNTGWAYYLVSLKQYVETGKGAPSPDVDFGRMLT